MGFTNFDRGVSNFDDGWLAVLRRCDDAERYGRPTDPTKRSPRGMRRRIKTTLAALLQFGRSMPDSYAERERENARAWIGKEFNLSPIIAGALSPARLRSDEESNVPVLYRLFEKHTAALPKRSDT